MKYIRKIDERGLYSDGIGKVELYDFSRANQNEESRIEAISTIASICYGKPPKDAKKLVERLWSESGGLPSSAFEFVRIWPYFDIRTSLRHCQARYPADGTDRERFTDLNISKRGHRENVATFLIKVPIFVARQVMRHRSMSFQEISRRYTTDKQVPFEFWMPPDKRDEYSDAYAHAVRHYQNLIAYGVRPEVARATLPMALYTQFYLMADVPALKNYFKLRLDKHAQKEHRELAEAMLSLLEQHQSTLYRKVKP